ncbi:MAG: Brp/Blh family beta-carotene 15,15'-dioxygenase [Planctomycetota bacterium]
MLRLLASPRGMNEVLQTSAGPAQFDVSRIIASYTWFVGSATLACAAGLWLAGPPSPSTSAVVMLVAVAMIGLPHGSYDMEVGRRLLSARVGRRWWIWFGVAYLALAALAAGLWALAPLVGLVLLLVGGAVHWGVDDLETSPAAGDSGWPKRLWLGFSRGAVPVAAPMLLSSHEVAEVFAALLGRDVVAAGTVSAAGALWLVLALPGLVYGVVSASRVGRGSATRAALEPVVLLCLFASVPAILGFALYFCFWHSVRHSIRSAAAAGRHDASGKKMATDYLRAVATPTVLTWLLGLGAWLLFAEHGDALPSMWGLVFVGLFALTVPHVLLELLEHRLAGDSVTTHHAASVAEAQSS